MKAFDRLPEGYKKYYSIDLQKDRRTMLVVNGIAVAVVLLLMIPMLFVKPITSTFDVAGDTKGTLIKLAALLVLYLLYIVLHEVVRGIAMKLCGTEKVKYGFTGMYAFAGSDDFYDKSSYLFNALAPIVLWGIVIGVITPFVPTDWFWVVYFIQIGNLSGAAGDLFVTVKFSRFPTDILVKDYGVGMNVFSKN